MGEPATAESDVYSLGIVLYELLSGRRPWEGDNAASVAMARITAPSPHVTDVRPNVPQALEAIDRKALAPRPEDRFRTAGAMATALEAFLEERPAQASAAGGPAAGPAAVAGGVAAGGAAGAAAAAAAAASPGSGGGARSGAGLPGGRARPRAGPRRRMSPTRMRAARRIRTSGAARHGRPDPGATAGRPADSRLPRWRVPRRRLWGAPRRRSRRTGRHQPVGLGVRDPGARDPGLARLHHLPAGVGGLGSRPVAVAGAGVGPELRGHDLDQAPGEGAGGGPGRSSRPTSSSRTSRRTVSSAEPAGGHPGGLRAPPCR